MNCTLFEGPTEVRLRVEQNIVDEAQLRSVVSRSPFPIQPLTIPHNQMPQDDTDQKLSIYRPPPRRPLKHNSANVMCQKRSSTIHSYPTSFESLVDREFRLPIDRGRGTFQVQRTCEPA